MKMKRTGRGSEVQPAPDVEEIRNYLEKIGTVMSGCVNGSPSMMRFLLDHARPWLAAPRPKGIRKRSYKQCFANSQEFICTPQAITSGKNDEYTYVEGYAINSHAMALPVHHGWLVDKYAQVLDLTWEKPQGAIYFGIPFRFDYVLKEVRRTGFWGSLLLHVPLLAGVVERDTAILPNDAWPGFLGSVFTMDPLRSKQLQGD